MLVVLSIGVMQLLSAPLISLCVACLLAKRQLGGALHPAAACAAVLALLLILCMACSA
jgi:hypothetical protein